MLLDKMRLKFFSKNQLKFFNNIFKNDPGMPKEWCNSTQLDWFSPYGISCFSYSVIGWLFYVFFYTSYVFSTYPIPIPIMLHIFGLTTQSLFSFMGDVVYKKKKNVWHTIDRFSAVFNIIFLAANIFWVSNIEKYIFLFGIINGIYIFKKSRKYRKELNINKYAYYHTLWHLILPFYLLIWIVYRELFIN